MKKILVVDDEVLTRRVVSRLLDSQGYHVLLAKTGEAALSILATGRPAAMICDLVMPGMGGIEVVRTVRATSALADLPILVLSGRGSTHDRDKALAAGANTYMAKPFSSVDLVEAVARLLGPAGAATGTVSENDAGA